MRIFNEIKKTDFLRRDNSSVLPKRDGRVCSILELLFKLEVKFGCEKSQQIDEP